MAKLFFYDVETTGLSSYRNAIHQISGAIVIDGEVKEEFNFHVAPHAEAVIEESALAVSSVTKEQIMAYPENKVVYRQIMTMLGKYCDKYNKKDKFYLVGYNNASFDNDFLRNFFKHNGDTYFGSWFWSDPIDVLILAANYLMEERPSMENFQLRTVAKKLGISVDETKLHDATYDIYLTRAIYEIVRNGKKSEGVVITPPIETALMDKPKSQHNGTNLLDEIESVVPLTDAEAEAALRESGLLLETPTVK